MRKSLFGIRSLIVLLFWSFFGFEILIHIPAVQDHLKRVLIEQVKTRTGAILSFGDFSISPTLNIYATNISLLTENFVEIHAERASLSFSPFALIGSKEEIAYLNLEKLKFNHPNLSGETNGSIVLSKKGFYGELPVSNLIFDYFYPEMKADGSGKLVINGTYDQAQLSGTINVKSFELNLPKKSPALTTPLEVFHINSSRTQNVISTKNQKSSKFPIYLDIELLASSKTVKVKDDNLSSKWRGEVVLHGLATEPEFFGELKIEEGTYRFRGKSFELTQGTITFDGPILKKTSLYIIAGIEVDDKNIEAIVKGLIKSPAISFRANPPMSQREIVSWLLFHRGLGDGSPFESSELSNSPTRLPSSSGNDTPDLLTKLSNALGVDHIEIQSFDESSGSDISLKIGKYVSKNTLISISKSVTDASESGPSGSLNIESNLGKNFKIKAQISDDSQGKLNLLWKKDY